MDLADRRVVGVRVILIGSSKNDYLVGYQVASATSITADLNTLGPSREKYNGSWLEVDPESFVYSLSVGLVSRELKNMRAKHAALIKAGKQVGEDLYDDAGKKKVKKKS